MEKRIEWRRMFDLNDARINAGKGYSEMTNEEGNLAWAESYLLLAYMEMYRATRDRYYLRKLVEHFDRVLRNRDDRRGIPDTYAGKPLAGWGSTKYSRGQWHVWIVHTGMITLAPAEFVRLVRADRWLHAEFGSKAQEYARSIAECIQDTDNYWRDGPARDEGYYFSPHLNNALPLNQQNAMGSVLIEMAEAMGDATYRRKAERLARFFRNRLRKDDPRLYDWSYWPKPEHDDRGSEDISHASLNVDFAVRCIAGGIVFDRRDAQRFANTWLLKVKRTDGTWAGEVSGREDGMPYMPHAAGIWCSLCRVLPRQIAQKMYSDVERAYSGRTQFSAADMLGLARLTRYLPLSIG